MTRIVVSILVTASYAILPVRAVGLFEQFDSPGKPKERHGIHWPYRDGVV